MIQDVGCDTRQPGGHVQDAGLRRRIQAGAHLELAQDCTLPVLVQLAIRAVKNGSVGVGLVKSHTGWKRLAKAGHQGGRGQAGGAKRQHGALAAHRRSWGCGRGRKFRVFMRSGGSRVRGGAAEERVDLSEILDAGVGHSEVCLKLGHSCLKGEDLVLRCHRLRITGGAGRVRGIFLKPVFR